MATKSTGVGRGGKRKGSGRRKGSDGVLPLGAVRLIKSLKRSPPEGAPPEDLADAESSYQALRKVMALTPGGRPAPNAMAVLKAAALVRDEVCGTLVKKFEVSDPNNIVARLQAGRERAAAHAGRRGRK